MFQRFTRLFFSEGPAADPIEPKTFVSEEEDDGWLIIDIPDSFTLTSSGEDVTDSPASSPLPHSLGERIEGPGHNAVGSSPLEDLLIEHPSMSVYITSDSIVVERDAEETARDRSPSRTRVERRTPHHATSVTAKAAILGKVGQVSRIQRAKAMVDKRKLGRKNLQRQNLAREFQGRNMVRHRNYLCQPKQRQCNH
ncbi:tumor protein p53-inducible nuclear protein 2 isoform X2 [Hyla sarda]|uniref:tumor protein p53-inducible nuclear protein 2 isoform X2 n=1 Tax=Hyla sarda TaxID=327740 RepID=UPI0024C23201|nr:tumor protein p53-inducible nuclear protein 2 isoform X2 [Hyla sarda]